MRLPILRDAKRPQRTEAPAASAAQIPQAHLGFSNNLAKAAKTNTTVSTRKNTPRQPLKTLAGMLAPRGSSLIEP